MILGAINRILGGVLGTIQTALIACAIITFSVKLNIDNPNPLLGPIASLLKPAGEFIFSGIKQI